MSEYHIPALLAESLETLQIRPNGIYVDCTYGGGGHSKAILDKLGRKGKLIAFDLDPDATSQLVQDSRLTFINENYGYIKNFIDYLGHMGEVDGIIVDLGISSHQIDTPTRGFSYRYESALDMRMNSSNEESLDAYKIINTYGKKRLFEVFKMYGEVPGAYKLSQMIEQQKMAQPIKTTTELADIVKKIHPHKNQTKVLAQVFQALRIETNDEMKTLEEFLPKAVRTLRVGGRLLLITYHSIEAKILKSFMQKRNEVDDVELRWVARKTMPTADEIKQNPRVRTAILRSIERVR